MKAYTKREQRGDIVEMIIKSAADAVVLTLNDRYNWRGAAENAAADFLEIMDGYAEQAIAEHKNINDLTRSELHVRGFDKFEVVAKKGARH